MKVIHKELGIKGFIEGFESIFSGLTKGREKMTSRGFFPTIQVIRYQESMKSRKPLRSVLGGICGRLMGIHHIFGTENLKGVLMPFIAYIASLG